MSFYKKFTDFKTDAPYNAVYSRLTICKGRCGSSREILSNFSRYDEYSCLWSKILSFKNWHLISTEAKLSENGMGCYPCK